MNDNKKISIKRSPVEFLFSIKNFSNFLVNGFIMKNICRKIKIIIKVGIMNISYSGKIDLIINSNFLKKFIIYTYLITAKHTPHQIRIRLPAILQAQSLWEGSLAVSNWSPPTSLSTSVLSSSSISSGFLK